MPSVKVSLLWADPHGLHLPPQWAHRAKHDWLFLVWYSSSKSYVFPNTFTLSIRVLDRHTKRGSSGSSVSSSTVRSSLLSLTGLVADHKGYHGAMCLPLGRFFVGFAFPVYWDTVCARELDGLRETKTDYHGANDAIGDIIHEQRRVSEAHEEKSIRAHAVEGIIQRQRWEVVGSRTHDRDDLHLVSFRISNDKTQATSHRTLG